MASGSVGDFGVLHRALVREVEDIDGGIGVYVECGAIAANRAFGPLVSLVPNLAAGERVLLACLGNSVSDVVVVQRWDARWPTIAEVPGLSDTIGELATGNELAMLTDRVDHNSNARERTQQELDELERSLSWVRSRVEEVPDALRRQRETWRTESFGGPTRTQPPRARIVYSGGTVTLQGGADWPASGGWTVDPEFASGDVMNGSDATGVYLTAPIDGLYRVRAFARLATNNAMYVNTCLLRGAVTPRAANIIVVAETQANIGTIYVSGTNEVRFTAGQRMYQTLGALSGTSYKLLSKEFVVGSHFQMEWIGP